ncbi:hypothetical protein DRO54_05650, partial [Candidatus Bathyarchaeota archaeon]
QWINGDYNATNGDYIQVKGYIVTYTPVDTNAEPIMNNLATKLRSPLNVQLATGTRDIAITSIVLPKTVISNQSTVKINVTLSNQGEFPECFNLKLYANTTVIYAASIMGIPSGTNVTITAEWNTYGFTKGEYTIQAYVAIVPGETETTDNAFIGGSMYITIQGDINADYVVNFKDAILLGAAFGSRPGDPNWNPNADINGDNIINFKDAILLGANFGKTDP